MSEKTLKKLALKKRNRLETKKRSLERSIDDKDDYGVDAYEERMRLKELNKELEYLDKGIDLLSS